MKTLSRGSIRAAIKALRTHKGRSFLTMLGVIIGVSSVITIASIGQGIKDQVSGQINHVGKDLITVRPGQQAVTSVGDLKLFSSFQTNGTLSNRDLSTVQKTHGVGKAVPLGIVGGTARGERGTYSAGPVLATTDEFANVINQGMQYGTFFMNNDDTEGVVLGAHAAAAMFNELVPLGQTFNFRGQDFVVRGVLNDFGSAPLSTDVDFNNAIFIPYAASQLLTNNATSTYEILAKPAVASQADAVVSNIHASLLKLHGDDHDFTVLKQADNLAATTRVLDLLTQLVTGAAAISLLVGGIGIMNIMLVSVTERMHEIGIRKAVGATNRQILSEFMSEAIVLSCTGVVIGVIVSLIVNLLLRLFTSLTPVVVWPAIIVAAVVSIAIGVLFGSAPALKAARKDPIAALRSE